MTPFRLIDARSATEAATLLSVHGPFAQPIASGGDLLGLLKESVAGPTLAIPTVLVNLATAPELASTTRDKNELHIGAMTTLARLRLVPALPSILVEAIDCIASPQLRVTTTLGGNLLQRPRCLYFRHPDIQCFKKGGTECPAKSGPHEAYPGALFPGACHAGHPSDLAPVLIALNAKVQITGANGARSLPLIDLYKDAAFNREREAQLARDEILTAVSFPLQRSSQAFEKIAPRLANEFSWASAAIVATADRGRISSMRIALGGVAPGPWLSERAAELLIGKAVEKIDPSSVVRELIPLDLFADEIKPRALSARVAIERGLSRVLRSLATDQKNLS